jgi:hypothetical protein
LPISSLTLASHFIVFAIPFFSSLSLSRSSCTFPCFFSRPSPICKSEFSLLVFFFYVPLCFFFLGCFFLSVCAVVCSTYSFASSARVFVCFLLFFLFVFVLAFLTNHLLSPSRSYDWRCSANLCALEFVFVFCVFPFVLFPLFSSVFHALIAFSLITSVLLQQLVSLHFFLSSSNNFCFVVLPSESLLHLACLFFCSPLAFAFSQCLFFAFVKYLFACLLLPAAAVRLFVRFVTFAWFYIFN